MTHVKVLAPREVRQREHALRCELARMKLERDQARKGRNTALKKMQRLERQFGVSPTMHCVYCGAVTYGIACGSHEDLLAVDPHYNQTIARPTEAAA